MRENPTRRWRACATGSATLAMVLMVTACGTTPPVYTDASPPKLQRACQAVDEATGLQMTEIDRASTHVNSGAGDPEMLGEDDQSAGRPKANPKADAAESRTEGAAGVQSGRHRGAPRRSGPD